MPSNFWTAVGAIIDTISDEGIDPPRDRVIVEHVIVERPPVYRDVYPMIKREHFDRVKAEKAAKYFAANKAVDLNDLILCLKAMDFDSARANLCKALRRPITAMNYFERMEISDTFTWKSGVPSFIDN